VKALLKLKRLREARKRAPFFNTLDLLSVEPDGMIFGVSGRAGFGYAFEGVDYMLRDDGMAVMGTGSNHVVSDNKIVDGGGAPALINSIDLRGGSFHTISGNNIPDGWLLVDAASESILIGNRTRGIGTSAVGAGAVAGAGIVGVGNKVGVAGTAPTGLYFTINKGTGPVDTGNVE